MSPGLTSGGRIPSGKVKDCLAEVYFLSIVDVPTRLLVLTTPAFHELYTRITVGQIAVGVGVEYIRLPPDIQAEVDLVVRAASEEVSPAARRSAVAAEVEADL